MKSSSSLRTLAVGDKLREALALTRMYMAKRREDAPFVPFETDLGEYRRVLSQFGGHDIESAKVVEIGFGARPIRLAWLYSAGVDVWGMDTDLPLTRFGVRHFFAIWRRNGPERALKSATRQLLLGEKEWRDAARLFAAAHPGRGFTIPNERLVMGSAADPAIWARFGGVDFIYSETAFEHIPAAQLPSVVDLMADKLNANGVAFIRPNIFTGITGGHSLEWYPDLLDRDVTRRSAPWEHLRQNRFPANTYLNGLRYSEYVRLFSRRFQIVEIVDARPALGEQFITPEIANELHAYSREELLMNEIGFVLKRHV
ncbi:MAG TPA: hypothetical protein VMU93_11485 [Caulobacteraceae bacterium]|nr:hypothetical protein [Caulobacteraceae bacterium]